MLKIIPYQCFVYKFWLWTLSVAYKWFFLHKSVYMSIYNLGIIQQAIINYNGSDTESMIKFL